jgi:Protein of unknown function (DUF3078)
MRKITLLLLIALGAVASVSAQKVMDAKDNVKVVDKAKDAKEGWTKIGGIGGSFSLLNLINPRAGAGDNRIGFGGLLNYSANLVQGKIISNNKFGLQLDVVRNGKDPYAKATDVLAATSQIGYQVGKVAGKWYIAGLADFQSQLLPTYGTNFLEAKQKLGGKDTTLPLTGKLFAPAALKIAPGVIYKANANLTVLFSPAAFKAIIVSDKALAQTEKFFPQNTAKDKTVDSQIGYEIRADYANKFFGDKLVYTTTLDLYGNYLRNPQNIDLEWYHSIDVMVTKNIALNFKSDWFYDDDIKVFTDGDAAKPTKNVFFRNAFLLKFSRLF